MRAVKWTGYLVGLVAALIAVAFLILLATPAGLGVLLNVANRVEPGLTARGWSGSLLGGACVDELSYERDRVSVEIAELCARVDLWTSLDFLKLKVYEASADRVAVRTEPGPPSEAGYAPPLPFGIEVGAATLGALRINALELRALTASGRVDGAGADVAATLGLGDLLLDATARGPWRALAIDGTLLVPEAVAAHVTLDLTENRLPFSLRATSTELDLARWAARDASLGEPSLALEGDLDHYDFNVSGALTDPAIGTAHIRAEGTGDLDGVTVASTMTVEPDLDVVEAVGNVAAEGQIRWRPALELDLDVRTDSVSTRFGDYLLTLGGNVAIVGTLSDLSVRAEQLDGRLNDRPVAGSASLAWRDGNLLVDAVELDLGGGHVSAAGDLRDGSMSVKTRARTVPLALLDPRLDGTVSGSVNLLRYPDAPRLEAELHAVSPAFGGVVLDTADLSFGGSLTDGNINLVAAGEGGRVATLFSFRRQGEAVTIRLATLSAEYPVLEDEEPIGLALLEPVDVRFAGGELTLAEACLEARRSVEGAQPARICMSGSYPDGGARIRIDELYLPEIPLPAGSLRVQAQVNAALDLTSFRPLVGQGSVAISDLVARMDDYVRALGRLDIGATFDEAHARLAISSPQDQTLVTTGDLSAALAPELRDSVLDGKLTVAVDGIRLVEEFLPMDVAYEIGGLKGRLSATADVAGTVGEPRVSGTVQAKEAAWRVEATRTRFSAVEMNAKLADSRDVTFDVGGRVGEGSITLDGSLEGLDSPDSMLEAAIELDKAEVLSLPDYTASLSGKVNLVMTPKALQINADVSMPRARVEIATLPESAVSVSSDTVLVGAEAQPPPQQLRTTRVDLKLGKDVRLEAFGLKTRLGGRVTLTETPGRPPDLRGVLTLEGGTFEAYGQELQVTRGELTFIGPIDDPLLNVTASRTVERPTGNIVVSLVLLGSAKHIETEIRSSPVLPEGDALALLMTGRTLTEMTSGEQTSVYGAAIALGLYGASGVTKSLASTMGLEEIIVDEDQGEWEVGAAVRLQRNLYLRYTYSVFSRIGGVLLRYELTDRVSVQARTGDSQSIEIRYGVD